jgi:hypothetical protein
MTMMTMVVMRTMMPGEVKGRSAQVIDLSPTLHRMLVIPPLKYQACIPIFQSVLDHQLEQHLGHQARSQRARRTRDPWRMEYIHPTC